MPVLNCQDFGLDFVDHAGDQQLEVEDTIEKTPLAGKGKLEGKRREQGKERE